MGTRYLVRRSEMTSRPWIVWVRESPGVLRAVSNGFRLKRQAMDWARYLDAKGAAHGS